MKVVLFGATGMVGQGVLRECLLARDVSEVRVVGRTKLPERGPSEPPRDKVHEVLVDDVGELGAVLDELAGADAIFFCAGVSSAGMSEEAYTEVTYALTLRAAKALLPTCRGATFVYVSGAGTDASERGRTMWARVKGRTENALLALGYARAFMFRPGLIQPLDGIRAKTPLYRAAYVVLAPVVPVMRWLAPGLVTTTRSVGRAMLEVARHGAPKAVLESADIAALG